MSTNRRQSGQRSHRVRIAERRTHVERDMKMSVAGIGDAPFRGVFEAREFGIYAIHGFLGDLDDRDTYTDEEGGVRAHVAADEVDTSGSSMGLARDADFLRRLESPLRAELSGMAPEPETCPRHYLYHNYPTLGG